MNRFLARVKAYLDRGDTPPVSPARAPSSTAVPTALDTLDGHYAGARAVVDAGRGRHAVDTETRLMSAVPTGAPQLLATGPDIRPTINVELLRQVLQHITTYPRVWEQDVWWQSDGCGTSGCVAGWAVYFGVSDAQIDEHQYAAPVHNARGLMIGTTAAVAQDALGLSSRQAEQLFDEKNRLRRLWTLAEEWSRGEITVPDELPDGS